MQKLERAPVWSEIQGQGHLPAEQEDDAQPALPCNDTTQGDIKGHNQVGFYPQEMRMDFWGWLQPPKLNLTQ